MQVAIALAHVAEYLLPWQREQLNRLDIEALDAASEGGHRIEGMDLPSERSGATMAELLDPFGSSERGKS